MPEYNVYDVCMKTSRSLSGERKKPVADLAIATPAQLSTYLRALRQQRGLTQKEVASRMGLSQQGVSQLERNARLASFERVIRYCRLLGVTVVLRAAMADEASQRRTDW